ncbi:MAG: pyridoxamine 5'-phosphate oxidase family protein [Hyphomicrobiales bacterium]|nr:pyridoxamine 5'-phosphate oxidase family protein [Hyphomicrobiales bacterium]
MSGHVVASVEQLAALYGPVKENSLRKEARRLTPEYRRWLERAPFMAMATSGAGGLDCSPRGDRVGELCRAVDDETLVIPDRRGNNRLDSLRNIVADPRVGLLFMIPGITETLRINGRARISIDPDLLASLAIDGKAPVTAILVDIEAVYFQCARALIRSALWETTSRAGTGEVPTAGQMTKSSNPAFDADAYDTALRPRQLGSLY